MNIILYAIPFFFLLIGVELVLEKVRRTQYYRVNDAISSLTAGVLSRMIGIVKNLVPFTLYILVYQNAAFFQLPQETWVWVVAFVLYDFCYYWNHRFGHEMSVMWASHVVHHSSEDYNLTTALRQSSSGFLSFIFYLPMALLGFDPLMLLTVGALNLVYQFWVHTQHVPKLGWFEWFFVSPSNHRVHHAQNQLYLDRNYGGVFIIWDRLFGSFQEELEQEPPIYGVRKALNSWNPVWANMQVYSQLMKDSYRTAKWRDKFKVWFGRTGWRPDDVVAKYPLARVDLANFSRFDTQLSISAKFYCIVQYVLTTVLGVYLMMNAAGMPILLQVGLASFVVFSCASLGMLMENRAIGMTLEWAKNTLLLLSTVTLDMPLWLLICVFSGTLVSIFVLVQVKRVQPEQNNKSEAKPTA